MAMQNLRDKLLKAGLVDKKQKTQVDTQDRRDKKQKGAEQLAAEEAEKQRQFAAKLAAEAEAKRQAEAERAAERTRHADRERIRNLAEHWSVRQRRPGQRRFYFTRRSGHISYMLVNEDLEERLNAGALAIVECLDDQEHAAALVASRVEKPLSLLAQLKRDVLGAGPPPVVIEAHVLLPPEHAERVMAIDASAVRFWARAAHRWASFRTLAILLHLRTSRGGCSRKHRRGSPFPAIISSGLKARRKHLRSAHAYLLPKLGWKLSTHPRQALPAGGSAAGCTCKRPAAAR